MEGGGGHVEETQVSYFIHVAPSIGTDVQYSRIVIRKRTKIYHIQKRIHT